MLLVCYYINIDSYFFQLFVIERIIRTIYSCYVYLIYMIKKLIFLRVLLVAFYESHLFQNIGRVQQNDYLLILYAL